MIRHYYHAYADGKWRSPVSEHIAAIKTIDQPITITVGVVGTSSNRAAFEATNVVVDQWVEEETGFEQVTLSSLQSDLVGGQTSAVLYAHTKGAYNPTHLNAAWRRSMTRRLVGDWARCLARLDEVDVVGCHWLTPEEFPGSIVTPFFGGNFWWAHSDCLSRLPAVRAETRWDAEHWIGLGNPKAWDLLPGWPSKRLFRRPVSCSGKGFPQGVVHPVTSGHLSKRSQP